MSETNTQSDVQQSGISRRRFFGYAGALAGAGVLAGMSSCNPDNDLNVTPASTGIDLGSGDTGMLNYAYVLEQIEAAFYIQVLATPYSGMTAAEAALFMDIRDHEITHRELFKAALGSKAIPTLTPGFSSISFTSRDSVLAAARAFEDLGVAAYNGAGIHFTSAANLTLAGKIGSVEARHAAVIRELILKNSFADTTAVNIVSRIDEAKTPQQVLAIAGEYIQETLNAGNLPS